MASDFAYDVQPILEPLELAACRNRKDNYFTVLAAVTVARYVFAIEFETRFSVV
jgi:hypothetical protein